MSFGDQRRQQIAGMRDVGRVPGRDGPHGFALVAAILAIVVIAAMVSGGFFIAGQQFHSGQSGLQASAGLYVAEAGLNAALANWDQEAVSGMPPGATLSLGVDVLSSGDEYATWLTRLDSGQDDLTAYYLLSSVGRPRGPGGGRRHVALLLRSRLPDLPCCDAALQTSGEVYVMDGAEISGEDAVPEAWAGKAGLCDAGPTVTAPGIVTDDTTLVALALDAVVSGEPPIAQGGRGEDLYSRAELRYRELVDDAELRYPANTTVRGIGPTLDTNGECDRASPRNWGAPRDAAHPCFDYYPLVHAAGDLSVRGPGGGQGILLVDGDLDVGDGFEFYGAVIVRGRLRVGVGGGRARARIFGGVLDLDPGPASTRIAGRALLAYSSCALRRAALFSQLHMPHPLAQRAWYEIFK